VKNLQQDTLSTDGRELPCCMTQSFVVKHCL